MAIHDLYYQVTVISKIIEPSGHLSILDKLILKLILSGKWSKWVQAGFAFSLWSLPGYLKSDL